MAKVDKPLEWVTIQSKVPISEKGTQKLRVPKYDSSSDESSDSSDEETERSSAARSNNGLSKIKRWVGFYIGAYGI